MKIQSVIWLLYLLMLFNLYLFILFFIFPFLSFRILHLSGLKCTDQDLVCD